MPPLTPRKRIPISPPLHIKRLLVTGPVVEALPLQTDFISHFFAPLCTLTGRTTKLKRN